MKQDEVKILLQIIKFFLHQYLFKQLNENSNTNYSSFCTDRNVQFRYPEQTHKAVFYCNGLWIRFIHNATNLSAATRDHFKTVLY